MAPCRRRPRTDGPLVAAFAARASGDADRLDRTRVLGLTVGFVGVAALVGLDVSGGAVRAVALVPSGRVVVAVLLLTVACTVVALLAFFALIAEAGSQRALVTRRSRPSTVVAPLAEPVPTS